MMSLRMRAASSVSMDSILYSPVLGSQSQVENLIFGHFCEKSLDLGSRTVPISMKDSVGTPVWDPKR
jgi:hypothetical protein